MTPPHLVSVHGLGTGSVDFTFDRVVTAVGDYSELTVGGDNADTLVSGVGTATLRLQYSDPWGAGVSYLVDSSAALAFAGGGVPAYPLTGVTT